MAHSHKKGWRTNAIFLIVLWIVLLITSLTILSSVITPFLKTLQTQNLISLSWAGYAVASDVLFPQPLVAAVNGSWTVPTITPSTTNTYSAAWIGIGGQSDKTLIQCGTEHDSINGKTQYSVWYEMLPDYAITIKGFTVAPGDTITASVVLIDSNTNQWLIQIQDVTNGQSFRQAFTYNSSRLSAEWVVERPTVNNQITNLSDFGSVTFTNASAQIGNTIGTITAFPSYEIVMQDQGNNKIVAISSISKDGSGFIVNYP